MEHKYTSDGKKVAVIGKLNSTDYIVQEIFVSKDSEIPSGEQFIVKSLHDTPVVTWQDKELKKLEASKQKIKNDIDDFTSDYKSAYSNLKAIQKILKSTKSLVNNLPGKDIDTFTSFLTGTIEYLVVDEYSIAPPVKLIDKIISWSNNYGERSFDSIKLLSVMGQSNGELGYRIHSYSDGSGGSTQVYPFTNIDDATAHIQRKSEERINNERLGQDEYKTCLDLGIVFSEDLSQKYKNYQIKSKEKYIASREKEISENQKRIDQAIEDINTI